MGNPARAAATVPMSTCPLPTMADKLLFILTYCETESHSRGARTALWDVANRNANKWIHLLHPVLNQALADQELLPARTADELAAMLDDATDGSLAPAPLFGMMGPNVRSSVRQIPRSNKSMTVARRNATRSKTSS